jgi:arabinogalactan endo-1,4-beta-galactosidase
MYRITFAAILYGCTLLQQAVAGQESFLKGGDISMLQAIEDRGGVYKQGGHAKDPLAIFQDHGCNAMRLRLFHTPTGVPPRVNDLAYTIRLARRVKGAGMRLLLDVHYSDTWADPGDQHKPKAWEGLSFEELEREVFRYTRDVISEMNASGAAPDIVQIGNEITPGILWDSGRVSGKDFNIPKQWNNLARLLQAGVNGVREGARNRNIQTMIHIHSGGDVQKTRHFFDNLLAEGLDFDLIGLSYYPWWHSNGRGFDPLRENLKATSERLDKDVMVVETAYPWKPNCDDPTKILHRNALRPLVPGLLPSREGQRAFLEKIVQTVRDTPGGHGRGVFYWAPEYIPSQKLRPGREHLSLFDEKGNVLPGMRAFRE